MRILLDSTYLLPVFGIEVKGLAPNDYRVLRDMARRGMITLHYSPVSWVEIVGSIAKRVRIVEEKRDSIEALIMTAFDSIIKSRILQEVVPTTKDLKLALKMRLLGHKDVIDNLLYSMAYNNGMVFLSMDESLKEFLKEHEDEDLDPSIVKDHGTLFGEMRSL